MKVSLIIRRFFVPSSAISLYYYLKYRCKVSHKAEVDLSENLVIGRGTQVGSFSKIKAADGPLAVGSRTSIGNGCFITSGRAGIRIGNDCLISSNVSIVGNSYEYTRLDVSVVEQGTKSAGIRIGDDVWLGVGSVILDGVTVGDQAIVSPNSLVTSNVPARAVVLGVPARVIFMRD